MVRSDSGGITCEGSIHSFGLVTRQFPSMRGDFKCQTAAIVDMICLNTQGVGMAVDFFPVHHIGSIKGLILRVKVAIICA